MSNTLSTLAPIVAVQTDHDPVQALLVHRGLSGKVTSMSVHDYVPAIAAEHGETSVAKAEADLLKQIRALPAQEADGKSGDSLLLSIIRMSNVVAQTSGRGAGNHAVMSLATYDKLMSSTIEPMNPVRYMHVSEQLADDEIIVTHFSTSTCVDAGVFAAQLPSGDVLTCALPHWDSYFAYAKVK